MTGPVLVLGMHRSGTSVVARGLQTLGVHMGADLDPNLESRFFQGLNDWLLAQVGARWDRPEGIEDLTSDPRLRSLAARYLRVSLHSPRARRYSGWTFGSCTGPWGFKDPRTTVTWEVWAELFPDARFLHIRRHGVDVAASLRSRTLASNQRHGKRFGRNLRWARWTARGPHLAQSLRCQSLDGCFRLWELYLERAAELDRRLPERVWTVRYENLLSAPLETFQRIAEFLTVTPDPERLKQASDLVRPAGHPDYQDSDELRVFASSVADRLREYGDSAAAAPGRPDEP